jgi:PPK2 family polyphosphate:nucleotide phosphotransferase
MDYRKKLIVEPGAKVRLKDIDPGWHGRHEDEKDAAGEIARHLDRIARQQRLLYGEKRHALLIVLQGIDAAGKDGVCWHVIKGMNPQGVSVTGFKQPTPEERAHDFLWRVHPHAPGLGQVAVFNRSHYEDVLVVRVHKMVAKSVWSTRYDRINEFERLLAESGVAIVKFFLWISPQEQLKRFGERIDDPMRQWKISDSDYSERALWDDYVKAYEDMLAKCSTGHAPWYVLPSNDKWFRNLAASQIIAATLEDLHMKLPAPTVDLARIKAEYHATAADPAHPEKAAKAARGKAKTKAS